ncbi:MAG: thiamine pyrophosphate-binding protein [Gemmatimonadaceae bacterium]|nr:thiamine pyrophosphate-binding protein [Gemmatimonadaceae bacterium]
MTAPTDSSRPSGGHLVAEVLYRHGVRSLFGLAGGHIAPIFVEAKRRGIRVIDTRQEQTAAFAADATARLTGVGVAVVTAGPGVTNTLTALTNARMARSPMLLIGGATATVLRGRGSLQDIDQMAVIRPHVKHAEQVRRVADIVHVLERALRVAREGVPGPVFVELPLDVLYSEALVRETMGLSTPPAADAPLRKKLEHWYLNRHAGKVFAAGGSAPQDPVHVMRVHPSARAVARVASMLARAERPVMVIGSQGCECAAESGELADALRALDVPVFLAGMARGLLGVGSARQVRHHRKDALREADLVLLCGVPMDFRLDYGRHIGSRATIVSVNRDPGELHKNRRSSLAVCADADLFVRALAGAGARTSCAAWATRLTDRDALRDAAIAAESEALLPPVNPLALCREVDDLLTERSTIVADGGDFVATASYVVRPRAPMRWLDPGVFGTLGVGAGFAMAAKLARPDDEVWLMWGDGAAGYGVVELDTFVRHGLPIICIVGNDGAWTQIARGQMPMLGDDVGTQLGRTAFHETAESLGARGLLLDDASKIEATLREAREIAHAGRPVLVNAMIGTGEFRRGSLSM